MNEISVWFDMTGNFTINQTGEKMIHIHRIGNDKNHFTIILTCATGKNYKFFR